VQVIPDRWPAWLVHPRRRCCRRAVVAAAAAAAAVAAAAATAAAAAAATAAATAAAAAAIFATGTSAAVTAAISTAIPATAVTAAISRGGRGRVIGREEARALAEPVEQVRRVVRRRKPAVARGVGLRVARGNMSDARTGQWQ